MEGSRCRGGSSGGPPPTWPMPIRARLLGTLIGDPHQHITHITKTVVEPQHHGSHPENPGTAPTYSTVRDSETMRHLPPQH